MTATTERSQLDVLEEWMIAAHEGHRREWKVCDRLECVERRTQLGWMRYGAHMAAAPERKST